MGRVPAWLVPWLVPVALVIGVVGVAISPWLGAVFLAVIVAVPLYLRAQYLEDHPPEPELERRRNFWTFR